MGIVGGGGEEVCVCVCVCVWVCLRVCEACVRAAWCVSLGGGGDERTGCTALEECVQPGGTSVKLIPPSSAPLFFSPSLLASASPPLSLPSLHGTAQQSQ